MMTETAVKRQCVVVALKRTALTSADIARRTGMGIGAVRKVLRALQDDGVVVRCTRWSGSMSYTFVYKLPAEEP